MDQEIKVLALISLVIAASVAASINSCFAMKSFQSSINENSECS